MVTRGKFKYSLNDLTRKPIWDAKVCSNMKVFEANPKRFARLETGHKSNRLIDAKISFYGRCAVIV